MAHTRTAGKPGSAARQSGSASRPKDIDRLREYIAELLLEAARFVPLARVEAVGEGIARQRDLATDDVLPVPDDSIGAEAIGVALVGCLTLVGDGRYVFASGTTPLDEAGLAVAAGFVRPGGRGLPNPQRCAKAVYRHVLRHGTLDIPGLNRPPEGEDDGLDGPMDELDLLALRWAEPGATRDPDGGEGPGAIWLAGVPTIEATEACR